MKIQVKKIGRQKGCIPWNKGIPRTEEVKRKISLARKGKKYLHQLENLEKGRGWNKGKKHKKETIEKIRQKAVGRSESANGRWMGDAVGYTALHNWVRKKLGKPTHCSKNINHVGRFCWANKSGLYKRDVNDWYQLCPSCNKTDGIKKHKRFLI